MARGKLWSICCLCLHLWVVAVLAPLLHLTFVLAVDVLGTSVSAIVFLPIIWLEVQFVSIFSIILTMPHSYGPGSISVRFCLLALKPNQTKPFIYNKTRTKPFKIYEAI